MAQVAGRRGCWKVVKGGGGRRWVLAGGKAGRRGSGQEVRTRKSVRLKCVRSCPGGGGEAAVVVW